MKISCPHCGQHYEVEEADLGKKAGCTNCGKHFQIEENMSIDASPRSSAPVHNIDPNTSVPFFDEEMKAFLLKVFLWIRKIASVICVIVAMYQMYNIQEDRQRTWLYNAHAIYDAGTNTKALVDLMRPVMFMLLALFIKPGRDTK